MLAEYDHGFGFAAGGREAIEFIFGLELRGRALCERHSDIAALEIFAGVFDLSYGSVRMHDYHLHAAFIFPERADGAHDRKLLIKPGRARGFVHRANDAEFVADVDALALALIDIDVVVFLKGELDVGAFTGDQHGAARRGLARD